MIANASIGCFGDDTDVGPRDAAAGDASAGTRDAQPDVAADVVDAATACAPLDAAALEDAEVQLGLALVKAHKCQGCHGQVLSGNQNGVPSPGFGTAYPPNLTPDEETGLGCWSEQQIVDAIRNGIDDEGRVLCPPMPRFGDAGDASLDPPSALAVARFLRSLAPQKNQVPDTDCTHPIDAGAPDATDAGEDASVADATADDAGDAAPE